MTTSTCSQDSSNWYRIKIMSAFAFLDAFQFAFFVWTFWPYAQQLDPTLSATFVGLIMAVSGVGEAAAAPIFGAWMNHSNRVVNPLIGSIIISIIGNIMYITLNAWPVHLRYIGLLVSRFLNGAGSGNRGCYIAYIALVSSTAERARAMGMAGGGALIGLNFGPAIQIILTWIGEGWSFAGIRLSMYTAPAVLALVINFVCVIIVLLFVEEYEEVNYQENSDEDKEENGNYNKMVDIEIQKPEKFRVDVIAVTVVMVTRAARMFMTANVESIGAPFSEIMFNLDEKTALGYNSKMQFVLGALTTFMFFVYSFTPYTKWISERVNCYGAMIFLLMFHLITMSWPFLPGQLENCAQFTVNGTHNWYWCDSLKPINMYLYYVSYALIFGLALPCLNNSLQALLSIVLGKGCQGLMQGLNQSVGSIARIVGPLAMSSAFEHWGPRANWIIEITLIMAFIIIWTFTFNRLRPQKTRKNIEIALKNELGKSTMPSCVSATSFDEEASDADVYSTVTSLESDAGDYTKKY